MGVLGHMSGAHGITFVTDGALAEGQNFMFIGLPDGGGHIFYRESAVSPEVLEDSWAAYRRLLDDDGPDDGAQEPLAPPMKALALVPRRGEHGAVAASSTFGRYAI